MGAETLQGDAITRWCHARVLLDPALSDQLAVQSAQLSRCHSLNLGDTILPGLAIVSPRLRVAFEEVKQHGVFKWIGFFKHASLSLSSSVRVMSSEAMRANLQADGAVCCRLLPARTDCNDLAGWMGFRALA